MKARINLWSLFCILPIDPKVQHLAEGGALLGVWFSETRAYSLTRVTFLIIMWGGIRKRRKKIDADLNMCWFDSRALASSAPIWQFPGMVPCGDFYKIVTQDFARSGSNCDKNIRMSWKAIENVSATGKSQLWWWMYYSSRSRAQVVELMNFSRRDGSVSSGIKSNCGKIKRVFMVLVSFASIWPSVVVGGIWFVRSSSEQERRFRLQELASGDLGESGHGGLSLRSRFSPASSSVAYSGTQRAVIVSTLWLLLNMEQLQNW